MEVIRWLNNQIFWGIPMLLLFLSCGFFFSVKLRFFQVTKLGKILKSTLFTKNTQGQTKNLTPFQTLTATLGTTLGTGNIIAVGTAIAVGGAGAVFWMWVSAILGMVTAYAETVLGMKYRKKGKDGRYEGGPFYTLRDGLGFQKTAKLFAFFCVLGSFGMGNMAQINAMAGSLKQSFSITPWITGLLAILLLAPVVLKGANMLGKVTQAIIPFISLFYILGCLIVISFNITSLPSSLLEIVTEAFNLKSMGMGILGSVMVQSMSWGFRRGVFSNEAGLGSSVIFNTLSSCEDEKIQGVWGMLSVFIDTIVICTLTALAILTSGVSKEITNGTQLAQLAFQSVMGDYASGFLAICIAVFALATVAGWSVFGVKCMTFLFDGYGKRAYIICFLSLIYIGAVIRLEFVWELSDLFNALMAIPNLLSLFLLSKEVQMPFSNPKNCKMGKTRSKYHYRSIIDKTNSMS